MGRSSTTLEPGDNLPARGRSNKTRILEALRLESFDMLSEQSTKDEAEVAFFHHVVRRIKAGEADKDSGMLLKWLGDKGWSNMKPTSPLVEFDYPKNGTVLEKARAIESAMSSGNIPPDIGLAWLGSLANVSKIEETEELKNRIAKIEEALNAGKPE